MRQKSGRVKQPPEKIVKELRRLTQRKSSAEEKSRVVLLRPRGGESIAEPRRRERAVQSLYYHWLKDFRAPSSCGGRARRCLGLAHDSLNEINFSDKPSPSFSERSF
jgi:transposase-like protein